MPYVYECECQKLIEGALPIARHLAVVMGPLFLNLELASWLDGLAGESLESSCLRFTMLGSQVSGSFWS